MADFKTIDDLDMDGKVVLTRVDVNVPMEDGRVTDATRIEKIVPTVKDIQARGGIPVLLAGMYAARNLGPDYVKTFDAIYPDLAHQYGLVLYPFFMDGVGGVPKLTQSDGLHPTADGVRIIVQGILPSVESFLTRLGG